MGIVQGSHNQVIWVEYNSSWICLFKNDLISAESPSYSWFFNTFAISFDELLKLRFILELEDFQSFRNRKFRISFFSTFGDFNPYGLWNSVQEWIEIVEWTFLFELEYSSVISFHKLKKYLLRWHHSIKVHKKRTYFQDQWCSMFRF